MRDSAALSTALDRPARPRIRPRVILGLIVLAFGLFVLYQLRAHNYGYFIVSSESMEPTIRMGDRVFSKRVRQFQPGDVVVFHRPDNPGTMLVKRLMAIGPARVTVERGRLFVDGTPADPPSGAVEAESRATGRRSRRAWDLKSGEVFVAGDNRPVSKDSRDYGPLPAGALQGVVAWRIESPLRFVPVK